jgi:hypothetical protein
MRVSDYSWFSQEKFEEAGKRESSSDASVHREPLVCREQVALSP